ncbi:MAG: hypothetical protein RSF34_19710, partial [Flavobacterium sp.]|uniref:endonuclease/exonuclease/phosphatase family protein n=1 Tax=Flavobacterium sp. TaxID=239 RepID=UPI003050D7FD
MKNKILLLVSLLFFGAAISSVSAFSVKSLTEDNFKKELKVLSLNTWHEGTTVKRGFDAIVDVILQSDADIVLLSEIRNYKEVLFTP